MVSLKQFVNTEVYREFLAYLDAQIAVLHTSMESARQVEDVYRMQGQIAGLRRLKMMKEDLLKKDK